MHYRGKEIEITKITLHSGSFPVGRELTYHGDWYEAKAKDSPGNEYRLYWTIFALTEDEADACDWENPDYISVNGQPAEPFR